MSELKNRDLLLPYVLPYALYVLVASVPTDILPREANYAVRLVLVGAALAWGWKRYSPLRGPGRVSISIGVGILAGLIGTVVWIALIQPFDPPAGVEWELLPFVLRVVAAVALVPLFEELLLRGFVLRLVVQWGEAKRAGEEQPFGVALDERSVNDVAPGAWTLLALVISTVLFALGHAEHEWVAAIAYGLLMAGLWILRRDLLTCVVAHAATNGALAAYVMSRGAWELW